MSSQTPPATAHAPTKRELKQAEKDLKMAVHRRSEKDLPWRQSMWFVARLAKPHPWALTAIVFIVLLLTAAEFIGIGLIIPILDALMAEEGSSAFAGTPYGFLGNFFEGRSAVETVQLVALGMVGLEVFKGSLAYGAARIAQWLNIRASRDLRMQLFDDVMNSGIGFINRERTANLFTILHSFPSGASAIMSQMIISIQNFASFAALVVLLVLISWKLTILVAVLSGFAVLAVIWLTNIVRRRAKVIREARLELHRTTLDTLQGMKLVQQFGRQGDARHRYHKDLEHFQRSQFRSNAVSALVQPVYGLIAVLLIAGVLFGATKVFDTSTDAWLVPVMLFAVVSMRFNSRSGKYAKRRTEIAKHIPEVEAMMEFLGRKDKQRLRSGKKSFRGLKQGIRFEHLDFRYDKDEPLVLRDVSFEIPKGKMVALVGGSGAGKSTIADLVSRLYDPERGRITVDGTDLRDLRLADWRNRVATVSQDTFLFNTSVRENLRFARPGATDEEVVEAAKQANAHGFIQELPQGYDTVLGDRGVRLSGGQAQRLAIARAIVANPAILILDEATSALDTATEYLVQTAIDRVSKDRTILAIAHRLSTVRQADEIIVLEKGRVVERGRHEDLLARKGAYWRYVQMQDVLSTGDAAFAELEAEMHHDDDGPVVLEAEELLFANPVADVLEVLREGGDGSVVEAWSRPSDEPDHAAYLFVLDTQAADVAVRELRKHRDVIAARTHNGRVEVAVSEPRRSVPAILAALTAAGVTVTDLEPGARVSLKEVEGRRRAEKPLTKPSTPKKKAAATRKAPAKNGGPVPKGAADASKPAKPTRG